MASSSYMATSFSVSSHENASVASHGYGDMLGSSSSHGSAGLDDYKILQPGDFKRNKSQISLRSRPASRIDYAFDSASSTLTATASNTTTLSQDSSPLPPDFDLVVQNRPRDLVIREARDRATFGPWIQDSEDEDQCIAPIELKEELVSVADEASDAESVVLAANAVEQPVPAVASSSPKAEDAHLSQLKQEAEEAWAKYRPGMTPQQRSLAMESDIETSSSTSEQPNHIPPRITSLRRSSLIVLTALPKPDLAQRRGSVATLSSTHSHTSSVHDKGTPSSQNARLESEVFPRITTPLSRGSAASWRGPPSSDLHFHRPYTASILSSTSEGSFLSYQNSFESGMSPLLLNRSAIASRLPGRLQRPATSGSIPNTAFARATDLNYSRPLLSGSANLPDMGNQLTAEERRQQVRRTKKLTQMLGEEMLLASNTAKVGSKMAQQPHASSSNSDNRRKKYRPQSMPFSNDASGSTGSKTRALSRKLLPGRSHGVKSWDHAFAEMVQPPPSAPAGLNRKAAAILGLPHPYSSGALARVSGEEMLESEDELDVVRDITHSARQFIPSGLEEFNEPTPKVAQLAAFSAAALDEGASPTLPQDGPFRPFGSSHLDQALAVSESRKLAAARDERRRRVAKMSRWLGEAVPAELIMSGTDQTQNAVIRSTGTPNPSCQSSTSHDSAGYAASEIGSMRRTQSSSACLTSSNGHGSISHEGSLASNLQSFMSIDSSDDESDNDAAPINSGVSKVSRPLTERRSVAPSSRSTASGLPDNLSAYRNSIDSYEYLLENDHERLNELASIFHGTRIAPKTVDTAVSITRTSRSIARPNTSPSTPFNPSVAPRPLVSPGDSPATRPQNLSASVGGVPRRSAAFLELSDSESDSSDADEPYDDDELSCYSSSLRQKRLESRHRSISKLSNFFGSTPSQIVQSQSDIQAAPTSSADSISTLGHHHHPTASATNGKISQPDALKTMLRSLEEEALDDSKLTNFQKSEISRKVHLLKKRTTKMFA
ncbi:uncharacterized protein UTRI_00442 [Ustilago trichophora]|uniref:Uncharacterized protein n=1 Tax=Ustilago trichophora TaxID=86804 RepID=A0A5C3DRI9_9BASI|nr:uncharacterized protein UTRI_00442 [Ustilago trichophora]